VSRASLVLIGALVLVLAGCRHSSPTEPTKDPLTDHQACLDAGGMWGPWATHFGCRWPDPAPVP
jgi:hypothetical protein